MMIDQLDQLTYKNKNLEIKLKMLRKKFENQVDDQQFKDQEIIKRVEDLKQQYNK